MTHKTPHLRELGEFVKARRGEPGSTSYEKLRILTSWTAPLPHVESEYRPD
ncbi:hypothetical protein ACW9HR_13290 [Nocardia gipuzkoensis]